METTARSDRWEIRHNQCAFDNKREGDVEYVCLHRRRLCFMKTNTKLLVLLSGVCARGSKYSPHGLNTQPFVDTQWLYLCLSPTYRCFIREAGTVPACLGNVSGTCSLGLGAM